MTWSKSNKWLWALGAAFAVFALLSIILFTLGVGSLKITHSNSSWALMQLQMEQQKMQSALKLYRSGQADIDELYLRYEVMWSRFPVLLEGEERKAVDQVTGADHVIRDYFTDFKTLEPLFNQDTLSELNLQQVQQVLDRHATSLDRLINQFFHVYRYYQLTGNDSTLLASRLLGVTLAAALIIALTGFYLLARQLRAERLRATQDPVTGLPKRAQLLDTLHHIDYDHQRVGLMLFDIESFRMINGSLGFETGDLVLRLTTHSLNKVRPADSQLFRTGNDEFALLLPVHKDTELQQIASQLQEKLRAMSHYLPQRTSVLFCCGAAISNPQRQQEALMQSAEMALTEARQQHRTGIVTFTRPLQAHKTERLRALSETLRQDLEQEALTLHFQPILDACTQQVRMVEASPRWYHPRFGQVSTRELWQLAENSSLTRPLSHWMLNKSLQQLQQWHAEFSQQPLALCIPISNYLLYPELPPLLAELLKTYEITPDRVTLQIDGDNPSDAMTAVLYNLHKMGLKLALGGFGRNPASLVAFQRVLLDYIKIDCTLYTELTRNRKQQILLRGILQIARRLNIRIIFDQINTSRQFQSISSMVSANWVQGDHFCRALPAEGINLFMLNHTYLRDMQEVVS
ncbi:EAL domain-containing protein [Plesiomonas shigelloides]|uniref:EAL domain-containing protein n=1 Tax=Plesiomonas shigelloides TaxID=703 RepID=UPI001783C544|nr:EAL domain-containing protein [Plesiomonas shigelloides]QOH80719.1 EAL domain-containing protein [Plesiomonas shigelloides]